MKIPLIFIALCVAFVMTAPAQNYNSLVNPVWHASLPKADLTVAVNSISSVLLQEYLLQEDDQQVVVTELNIETIAGNNTRIFFAEKPKEKPQGSDVNVGGVKISTNEMAEKAKEMARSVNLPVSTADNKSDNDTGGRLVKKGSGAILAKILEIQASSAAQVRDLHQSLLQKWLPNE